MGYEYLEHETLVTLEGVLSRAVKSEKNSEFKKDIEYELDRVKKAL